MPCTTTPSYNTFCLPKGVNSANSANSTRMTGKENIGALGLLSALVSAMMPCVRQPKATGYWPPESLCCSTSHQEIWVDNIQRKSRQGKNIVAGQLSDRSPHLDAIARQHARETVRASTSRQAVQEKQAEEARVNFPSSSLLPWSTPKSHASPVFHWCRQFLQLHF